MERKNDIFLSVAWTCKNTTNETRTISTIANALDALVLDRPIATIKNYMPLARTHVAVLVALRRQIEL